MPAHPGDRFAREAAEQEEILDELQDFVPDEDYGPPAGWKGWAPGEPEHADAAIGAGFASGEVLDELSPGPALAGLAMQALDAGAGRLDDERLIGVLAAVRRVGSWAAALEAEAVGELWRRREATGSLRELRHLDDEIAAALTMSIRAGGALVGFGAAMSQLPATLAALRAGLIDRARAAVIVDELGCLDPVAAAAVEQLIILAAPRLTCGQLRARTRRAVLAADPSAADRRRRERQRDARVELADEGAGTAALSGRDLPTAAALAADARIDAQARALKAAGSPATLSQLRAAVFLACLTGQELTVMLGTILPETTDAHIPETADAPVPSGATAPTAEETADPCGVASPGGPDGGLLVRGSVHLTLPLTAWLGLSSAPGEIAGFGPADSATCRDLAGRIAASGGSRWCLSLTDPAGRAVAHACARRPPPRGPDDRTDWLGLLKLSRIEAGTCTHAREVPGYRIPDSLHHIVKTRQRTCSFPGCSRAARRCDDDHTLPHDEGGRSCECNLAPLCRRHHQAKQGQGWHLDQPWPGILVWRLPHGRRYAVAPGVYPS